MRRAPGSQQGHDTAPVRSSIARTASVAVEYALVLPMLLMFLLGLVDAGRLLWSYATLAHAVEAAARCAAANSTTCGTASAAQSYAAGQAWGLNLSSGAFTATAATCGMRVHGTLTFHFIVPWFYVAVPFGEGNNLTLSATACYPV